MDKIEAQFHVVKFEACDKFVATAWNHDHAIQFSTTPHSTFSRARSELEALAEVRGVTLKWFDGEYRMPKGSGFMVPAL